MENNINDFIKSLIVKAGLDKMPKDFLAEYEEKLVTEAQKRLGVVAMENLDKKQAAELADFAEKNSDNPEAVSQYLSENIKDFKQIMSKALQEFGEEVIASAQKAIPK